MFELHHGDCLKEMDKIPDNSVDMVLCDLPYGTTSAKWDIVLPFERLWEHYQRVLKDKGVVALFGSQPFTTRIINSNKKDYKYNWYWIKNTSTGFAFSKYQPMRRVEDICIFYKKAGAYKPQGLKRFEKPVKGRAKKHQDASIYAHTLEKEFITEFYNYPTNVLEFKKDIDKFHPTQKPVELLEYLINTYTNEGETVLDNCMGSGSTGVACIKTGRKFIGIEKDEKFFEIAKERIGNVI